MKDVHNTLHYLIAMLKAYGIKMIIASPGIQNSRFNSMIQEDDFFKCISVYDERSAAYVANGIATESNQPVVITCTGATSSRNYLPALTEAYYRKVPIIALTFFNTESNKYNFATQFLDRSVSQNDIKTIDVELPVIRSEVDKKRCLTYINAALYTAMYKNEPVHINCPSFLNFDEPIPELPTDIWVTKYYEEDFEYLKNELSNKKAAIFIGAHRKFTEIEETAISDFATSWSMPVFCDYTSNYNGKNKILIFKALNTHRFKNKPDLIIDIGELSDNRGLFTGQEVWRVAPNGEFKTRCDKPVSKTFNCNEKYFFKALLNDSNRTSCYYDEVKASIDNLKTPDLPLCNGLVCEQLSKYLPHNCSLHLAILNSFKNMNYFDLDKTIDTSCNTGGFGIDGAVSTLIGQSFCNPEKLYFGLIGDLAFFYDMNALGHRDIKNNVRIIVVNNNKGVEFRLHPKVEPYMREKTDFLISAAGHNKGGAQGWAESCGFHYMNASTKEDFLLQINEFCNGTFDKPVLFEVYTTTEDEQKGLDLLQTYNRDKLEEGLIKCYKALLK